MKRTDVLFLLTAWMWMLPALAQEKDSVRVEELLREAGTLPADSCRTLFFARQLIGIPYVAGTLDKGDAEALVIHLDKADCTTFVETVLALSVADREGKRNFDGFKQALRRIRYRKGHLNGYASRLHYVSDWIKDNEEKGFVRERTSALSSTTRLLFLNFMSAHPSGYPQLKKNPAWIGEVVAVESAWQGIPVAYVPKERLNEPSCKLDVRNGDVLAITTDIAGLDVVHMGFACWVGDKLHLLHASSLAKKVLLDPLSLYDYSKNKKTHTGVRVVSLAE